MAYDPLEALANPTTDLGGMNDPRALAQLILGGGSAAMRDANGQNVNLFGNSFAQGSAPPTAENIPSNLKAVLDTANRIAGGGQQPQGGNGLQPQGGGVLLPNPYGQGSYNPNDASQAQAVQADAAKAAKTDNVQKLISRLLGQEPSIYPIYNPNDPNQSAMDMKIYEQQQNAYGNRVKSATPIIEELFKGLGLGQSEYQKAFDAARGKAEGEAQGGAGANNKILGVDKASKLFKYNRETGQFETPPPNITDSAAQEAGYRLYTEKQRDAATATTFAKSAFDQFLLNKQAAQAEAEKSPLGNLANMADDLTGGRVTGGAGVAFNKSRVQLTTAFDQLIGGARGAASPMLTQIRLKVLPQLITEQGTSDKLASQFGELLDVLSEAKVNKSLGVPAGTASDAEIVARASSVLKEAGQPIPNASQAAPAKQSHPDGVVFNLNGKKARYMNGKLQVKD
jgi:hypothetical protein